MANNFVIGLAIGASLQSGFTATFSKAENAISTLSDRIATAQTKQLQLGGAVEKLKQKQRNALQAMSEAKLSGGNVAKAISEYQRLGLQITKAKQRQQEYAVAIGKATAAQNGLNAALAKQQARAELRQELKSKIIGTAGMAMTAAAPIKSAISFESAMADVRKVVDFETPDGFAKLSKELLQLTRTLPMTAEELAAIAASGGQLGVAEKDLKAFTTTIAKMSVAFDMSAEESGDAMAKLANVYQIPIAEIGKLGDAINELSNNSPAKARDIVNALGRVGGVAKQFGLTENAAASLSNAFISLGKRPEVAGTAINGMLTKLMTADKAGDKFQDALKQVGISATQLKKNIAHDGEAALVDFLKRLQTIPKDAQMGVLVDLFGLEYADDVAVLAGNVELLEKNIAMLSKTNEDGKASYLGSMNAEFEARAATTENNLKLLKNNLKELSITIGSTVLPAINSIVSGVRPVIEGVVDLSSRFPTLTKVITGVAMGFVGMKVAALGAMFAFSGAGSFAGFFSTAFERFKAAKAIYKLARLNGTATTLAATFPKLVASFKTVGSALSWLSKMFLTNPIGIAITAIAVGAYLIWDNWATLQPFFANLWANVTAYFNAAWEWIKSAWSGVSEWVSTAWGGVKEYFSTLWTNITDFFSSGIGNISAQILNWSPLGLFYQVFASVLNWFGFELPSSFTEFGANIIQGLIGGITSMWESLKETVSSMASSVKSWFTGLLGIHSPSVVFEGYGTNIGEGLAIGINNATGLAVNAAVQMANAVAAAMPNVATSSTVGVMNFATDLAKQAIKPPIKPKKTALPFAMGSSVYEPDEAASGKKSGKKGKKSGGSASSTKKAKGIKSTGSGKPKGSRSSSSPSNNYQPLRSQTTQSEQPAMPKSITVNFNPTINLGGANGAETAGLREQVQQVMQESAWEFEKLMYRILEQRSRRAY